MSEQIDQITNQEDPAPPPLPASAGKEQVAEIGKTAYEKAKEATGHAWEALKILLSDPSGGQGKVWTLLGEEKGYKAGLVFNVLFVAVSFFVIHSKLLSQIGGVVDIGNVKVAMLCAVLPAALSLSFLAFGMLGKTKVAPKACLFASGVAILPLVAVLIVLWLVGFYNIEVVVAVGYVALVFCSLLINSALVQVYSFHTRNAFVLTPLIVLVTTYLFKVIGASLVGHLFV